MLADDAAADRRSSASAKGSCKTPSNHSFEIVDITPAAVDRHPPKRPALRRLAPLGHTSAASASGCGLKTSPRSVASSPRSACQSQAHSHRDRDQDNDDDSDHDSMDGPPGSRMGRMDKASRVKHTSEKELVSMLSLFGEEVHFKNSKKKKHLESKLRQLRKWARSCGQLTGDEDANNLCERIFAEADEMEARQTFFEGLKPNFIQLVLTKSSDTALLKVIAALTPEILCQIVSQGCSGISTAALTDADAALAFFYALAGDGVERFGLRLVKIYSDNLHLVVTYQKTCMIDHLEQVLKQADLKVMVQACLLLTEPLKIIGDEKLASALDSSKVNSSDENLDQVVFGWPSQIFADLVCVNVMGRYGKFMVDQLKPPRDVVQLSQIVLASEQKMSARVRCYHKTLNGGGAVHPAKRVWVSMQAAAQALAASLGVTVDPAKVRVWVELLRSIGLCKEGNHVESDAVVEALLDATDGDESEEVRKFAEYSAALSPASTGDDAELFQLARSHRSLLLKGLSTLLIGMNYHAEVTGDVLTEFAITVVNDDKRQEEGAKEVTVKDAEYFDDPENLPEEVGLVKLTSMVCDLLKQFGASGEKVLNELGKRSSYHERFWKLTRYDITPRHTLIDKFKGMLEIYKADTWQESNNMRPIDQTDELWVLQTFLDKAASSTRFSKSICNLLDEQFSKGGPTSLALSRECIALEPTLPKEALRFVQAGKSFERLEDVAAKIAAGKQNVSLCEMGDVIGDCKFSTSVCRDALIKRECLAKAMELVQKDFEVQFAAFETKLKRQMCAATELVVKYGKVLAMIPTWSFDDAPWLKATRESPDSHLKALMHSVEQLAIQKNNLKSTIGRLAASSDWMSESLRVRVIALNDKVKNQCDDKLLEAKRVLANTMIVNCILTAKQPNTAEKDWPNLCIKTLKYIRTTIDAEDLIHNSLAHKVLPKQTVTKSSGQAKNGGQAVGTVETIPDTLVFEDDQPTIPADFTDAAAVAAASSASSSSAAAAEPLKKKRKVVLKSQSKPPKK